MAKKPSVPNPLADVDVNAQYRVKLNQRAMHGTSLLRPKNDHVMQGSALFDITPQEAIVSIEKVS